MWKQVEWGEAGEARSRGGGDSEMSPVGLVDWGEAL